MKEKVEAEQLAVPGTEKPARAKRVSLLERAVVGDVVVALTRALPNAIKAMEQVGEETSAEAIAGRWKDQGISDGCAIEVWEYRPGGYFRRRSSR